jgi:hypothetical protein
MHFIYIYFTKFVPIATNQKFPEFQRWSWIFRLDLTAQTLNCRQHLYYLVRADSQGGNHGGRVSQRHPIEQVWPLREVHEQASREDDRPRGCELRRREMGQTQEDPEPRVPSREAQGWLSNFLHTGNPRTYLQFKRIDVCVLTTARVGFFFWQRMQPAFLTCCTELIDRWDKEVAGSDGSSFELDVWPEFQSLTGDVISRTAFGSSFMEGRRIFQLQAEQAERVIKAFQYIYIPGFV